jgi:hypothetical protein
MRLSSHLIVKELLWNRKIFFARHFLKLTQRYGGAMRDRTADLLRAKQALSQLSYSPNNGRPGQI